MRSLRGTIDRILVRLGGNHYVEPKALGDAPHDCALTSLYWAVPRISESRITEAFGFCAENWPYGGVTNKEFAIALKYLELDSTYCDKKEALGALLKRRPTRCVALLHGHFIPILKGKPVGRDRHLVHRPDATVYCHWTFH